MARCDLLVALPLCLLAVQIMLYLDCSPSILAQGMKSLLWALSHSCCVCR